MSDNNQHANSWDTFWKGTSEASALNAGGANHPAHQAFWMSTFEQLKQQQEAFSILDIASGNGALVQIAHEVFNEQIMSFSCVDISDAAIKNIHKRFPNVNGIVSDANKIELPDNAFELVVSQYGIEYAGVDAIFEAARLVSEGGTIILVMHLKQSHIYTECQQSYTAIELLQQAAFIEKAKDMFSAGFAAVRGAPREAYDNAAKLLSPAISELENIMRQYGTEVAAGTISRLYNDVGNIHSNMPAYDPSEVLSWLDKMEAELEAYIRRMKSMCECAISQEAFEKINLKLIDMGFEIQISDKFYATGIKNPMAWSLIAKKKPNK
jgi:ubiquinone/menaquinone biosynthesis C-methylase UbiE